MTWTTDKPTQPGWYWYRQDNINPCILRTFEGSLTGQLMVSGPFADVFIFDNQHVKNLNGEWAGPLVPPKE